VLLAALAIRQLAVNRHLRTGLTYPARVDRRRGHRRDLIWPGDRGVLFDMLRGGDQLPPRSRRGLFPGCLGLWGVP